MGTSLRPNLLIVEGEDDRAAVIHLMRSHVRWPEKEADGWPVYVELGRSADEILKEGLLTAKVKEPGRKIVGVVLDADADCAARWSRVRQLCHTEFPGMPKEMPLDGLVVDNAAGKRLGAWIMPDCSSCGMLESFLIGLLPNPSDPIWRHAQRAFAEARRIGTPCHDAHVDKAHIHTWLAWQNPPGERFGIALTRGVLNPSAPTARPFVSWFKRLYNLQVSA